jgi:hypothetical protein
MNLQGILQDGEVAFTISWIVWVVFTSIRRYFIARTKATLQEKILQRIDSSDALVSLTASDSGRRFLESMTIEESQVSSSPFNRILFGVQAGIVLAFFGFAMLFLHHHMYDPGPGLIIIATGAIGLGLGFLTAAAASIFVSRQLGLISRDPRG